jgi:hemoglobin-like flavoprotein
MRVNRSWSGGLAQDNPTVETQEAARKCAWVRYFLVTARSSPRGLEAQVSWPASLLADRVARDRVRARLSRRDGAKMPAVNPIESFRASLKRCLNAPDFLLDFYGLFMASSDEVREKFKGTDFKRQTRVLADSLWAMSVAAQGQEGSPAWGSLPDLARRHSRTELDIRPGLYDNWLECLIEAARKHDPEFSLEIETAWRETLSVGIEYLRSRY